MQGFCACGRLLEHLLDAGGRRGGLAAQLREVLRRMDSGERDAIAPAHLLHYVYATDPAVFVPGRPSSQPDQTLQAQLATLTLRLERLEQAARSASPMTQLQLQSACPS